MERIAEEEPGLIAAAKAGWSAVLGAPGWRKALLAALFLLMLLMLPFGRQAPDAGGVLAPLCVDSGVLFRQRPAADFFSIYDAGARLLAGRDPYSVNDDTGGPGHRAPYVATFRYLPVTVLWLAAPLNVLPPQAAFVAWSLFNAGLLVFNFLFTVGRKPERLVILSLVWFAWFPMIAEFHMGQFSLLMGSLLLWAVDAWLRGAARGGIFWALATSVKVYTIAMAAPLILWGWRRTAVAVPVLLAATTVLWAALVPDSQLARGMGERGVQGRLIGSARVPYAGAQGPQELVNAVVWKLTMGSFKPAHDDGPLPHTQTATYLLNLAMVSSFIALWLWAVAKGRDMFSLEVLGISWLAWFYLYHDCWEHHYLLFQSLLALLICRGGLCAHRGILLWALAGGPSLWWLWQRSGYAGNPLAESLGLIYFVQRPLAVFLLTGILVGRIARGSSVER